MDQDLNLSQICGGPADSISDLAFSPTADLLAVSSWDKTIRFYECGAQGQPCSRGTRSHQLPPLTVCWKQDGNLLFSGGTDNVIQAWDLATNAVSLAGDHDGAVKCLRWTDLHGGLLISGGWDSRVKVGRSIAIRNILCGDISQSL